MITEIYNFMRTYLWGSGAPTPLVDYATDITRFISVLFAVLLLVLSLRLVFGFIFRLINWFRG